MSSVDPSILRPRWPPVSVALCLALGLASFSVSRWNTLVVDERTLETNVSGFFAGGDAVTGPATVVEALAAGHRAAVSIDCYLQGREYGGYWFPRPRMMVERIEPTDEDEHLLRPKMRELPCAQRKGNFKEVELGLDRQVAICEARRCLRCDL